jgi:hypothetical protein
MNQLNVFHDGLRVIIFSYVWKQFLINRVYFNHSITQSCRLQLRIKKSVSTVVLFELILINFVSSLLANYRYFSAFFQYLLLCFKPVLLRAPQ